MLQIFPLQVRVCSASTNLVCAGKQRRNEVKSESFNVKWKSAGKWEYIGGVEGNGEGVPAGRDRDGNHTYWE